MPAWKYYTFKTPNWRKNGKERQYQEEVANIYKCNMCNNIIKIILFCINTRKVAKGIKNKINAVDGQWLANNYDRQIQAQTNFRSSFIMLRKMRDNEFCDVTPASVDDQKFKAHKVILSTLSIFLKKLLVNNLNHHQLIFMRKFLNESHGTKLNLKETM